ncbi:RNA polymerase II mediator complex subunit [Sporothrix bragantina]|uniref:Mediator of RNA polymerase II transcription subunit 12 n=1 Tax=Sporothrix bragantina TaxID=671064 RepID=A0ABP0BTW9_9PEZI
MSSESTQPQVTPSIPPLPGGRRMDDARQQQQRNEKQLSQMQVLQQRILQQQMQKQQQQQQQTQLTQQQQKQLQLQKQQRLQQLAQKQKLQQQQQQKQQQQQQLQQPQQQQTPNDEPTQHHKPRQKQPKKQSQSQLPPQSQQQPPPIARAKRIGCFSIARGLRKNSLYRSLNEVPETDASSSSQPPSNTTQPQPLPLSQSSDLQQSQQLQQHHHQGSAAASRAGTPKHASTTGTPDATDIAPKLLRSDLPICSSRGRAPFGEFSWAIEPPQKEAEVSASTPVSTPAATSASSPTATPSTGNNGSSLRASMFKKSSSLAYGASSSGAGSKDTDGSDKDGQAKPWHLDVPTGIPYYVVPPAGRRLGALTKAGSRAFAASPAQTQQRGAVANGARPGAGTGFNNGRSLSGSGSLTANSSTANNSLRTKTATGGAGSKALAANSNNRVQKATVRYLDFNPWRGRHLEDRLTDSTVRMGQYDRLPNPQSHTTETGSARGWLPLLLRQKNSTMVLGQALALANALSREKNHISPASQFKLPPRVTVTDTRRETWLRDLTNAAIPLRKLSRTIPHGLRGKVLLEQCMLKSVPVDRAMWLARCVGAQELRAFKRKGTANVSALAESELRWLKDWTLTVQQFVETFLVEINLEKGTGEDRLQYAARFARQLYLERLLDQDQFLNWMLVGLRNAARLPAAAATGATPYFDLWLFIVEGYFHGIMQRRKMSAHLAVTILSRIEFLSHFQATTISSAQAKKLLKIMVQSHPDAFVSHPVWPRYEKLLHATLLPPPTLSTSSTAALDQTPPAMLLDAVSTIRHRNDCLRPETSAEMDQVVNYLSPLDGALRFPSDFATHFADFLRLDQRETVPFVIRWCASIHRPGLAKVYLAARLIGELCQKDAKQATNYILEYLSSEHGSESSRDRKKQQQQNDASLSASSISSLASKSHQLRLQSISDQQPEGHRALYQLVGLLMAQELFLPAHYLASLILRSRPSDAANIVPDGQPHVRLIAELPAQFLNQSTSSLRANHLRRLGYDTEYEAVDTEKVLGQVERVFSSMAAVITAAQTAAAAAENTPGSTATATSPSAAATTGPSKEEVKLAASVARVARLIEDRSRNVKMAVADWLQKNVIVPMRTHSKTVMAELDASATNAAALGGRRSFSKMPPSMALTAAAPGLSTNGSNGNAPLISPLNLSLEHANTIRSLIEKTDDLRLLSEFILAIANYPQSISVMALCADTVNLHLAAFLAMGNARSLYDKVMARSLAITVGVDAGANTAFQALLPPGTDVRPLLMALPVLAEKMPVPGPGSLILGANRQPIRLIPKATVSPGLNRNGGAAPGDELMKKHFEVGAAMATDIQNRLLEIDLRLSVATYDADCSPLSDGRAAHVSQEDAEATEAFETMIKIASSGNPIDSATMDSLFGSIAMVSQEQWRRAQPDGDYAAQMRTRDDFRLSASLFARLRRFNSQHFDTIMVKWLKRLRTMRERPAISTLFPVLVVFGCLDLATLLATTADEQPREPGAMIQSPARNTWRTSYLQDVLTLLSVPMADSHPVLTCDECQRFRVFQDEAPFLAPAGIASLVRNAIAEMTLWRHHERQRSLGLVAMQPAAAAVPRNAINALSVSRVLRAAAFADARKAGSALALTTDQTVRSGLWEMMTLAMTRHVAAGRSPLEMLRGLDIFAADVGQLALGLVLSPGPYASATERAKEADNLANLILRAVAEFQFDSLSVLHSLPADMATSLKDHAQARFLDMIPTRKHLTAMTAAASSSSAPTTPVIGTDFSSNSSSFDVAGGFLNIVRTILLGHQQQYQKKLEQQQEQQQQQQQHQQPQQATSAATPVGSGSGHASLGPPPSPGVLPASGIPPLDASVVEKLGELWCVLQEPTSPAVRKDKDLPAVDIGRIVNLKRAILRDWLPALLSLILLHLPNRDALLLNVEGISSASMGLGIMGMGPAMSAALRSDNRAPGSQGTSPATFSSPANTTAASMGFNMMSNINAVASNNSLAMAGAATGGSNHSATPGGGGGLGVVAGLARTSRDQEQEAVYAGACIALASLYMEVSSLADNGDVAVQGRVSSLSSSMVTGSTAATMSASATISANHNSGSNTNNNGNSSAAATDSVCGHRLALQSRLFDTALLFADSLSDETRQQCVRALREAVATRDGQGSIGSGGVGGDLQPVMAYILSSPVSSSIYYPRLILERLPQISLFGRAPPPSQAQRERSNASEGGAGNNSQTAAAGAPPANQAPGTTTTAPGPPAGPPKRMASGVGYGGFFGISGMDARIKRVRFGLKTWDAVSDPSPTVQDNDTAVNLWLLEATKVVRQRRR